MAALWGSLSSDDRAISKYTFRRPPMLGQEQTINHYPDVAALKQSAMGCAICQALISLPHLEQYPDRAIKLAQVRPDSSLVTTLEVQLWEKKDDSTQGQDLSNTPLLVGVNNAHRHAMFDQAIDTGLGLPGYTSTRTPLLGVCSASNPLSKRAIWKHQCPAFKDRVEVIKGWIDKCTREHSKCIASQRSSIDLPARFLDIGVDGTSPTVQLVLSSQIGGPPLSIKYIALSHCWGSPTVPPFKTTLSNLAANLQVIDIHALPRTYQDAITVSRAIGVRYLWIDSLCIVQDDSLDWMRESAKMADVYRGSYFTIAATSASNGHDGLFLDLQASVTVVHLCFDIENDPDDIGGATSRFSVRHPVASTERIWDAPLGQRAWVLQEVILSVRLIHFTNRQMYIQCHSGAESEDGTIKDEQCTTLRPSRYSTDVSRDLNTPVQALYSWWTWVSEYTSRSLTYSKDRMAAVSGILRHFQDETGQVPILGLWDDTLWFDLGWSIDSSGQNIPNDLPRSGLGVPAWSWLCLPPSITVGPLKNIGSLNGYYDKLKLVDWGVQWEREPFISPLLSSKLVVSAVIKSVGMKLPVAKGRRGTELNFEADWDEFVSIYIKLDQSLQNQQLGAPFFLQLAADPVKHYVLLLSEETQGNVVCYRRLGAGTIYHPKGHKGFFFDAYWENISLI